MLMQHFLIDEYNWEVYAFYYVRPVDRFKLCKFFNKLGYDNSISDVSLVAGVLNGGYCYTNYRDRRSIILVNIADSIEQMSNTVVHELNHLSSHIEEYYNTDAHSEEACYLIGNLAQKVSHFLN